MTALISRGLGLALVLLLAGCQAMPPATFEPLEQSLAEHRLEDAQRQFDALQQGGANETHLQPYRRRLADAYLEHSQAALQRGDLDRAAWALGQARNLMQAPALTTGLDHAIERARDAAPEDRDEAQAPQQ